MTTTTTTRTAALSAEWVDNILVTALDGNYGGSWYWINEEDDVALVEPLLTATGDDVLWSAVKITLNVPPADFGVTAPDVVCEADDELYEVTIGASDLTRAWRALAHPSANLSSDLREQLVRSKRDNDLDVDASVADCLFQQAIFGTIVYG